MLAPKTYQNRVLEASWGVWGASWGLLRRLGRVLERLGLIWERPGGVLERLGRVFERLRAENCVRGAFRRKLCYARSQARASGGPRGSPIIKTEETLRTKPHTEKLLTESECMRVSV